LLSRLLDWLGGQGTLLEIGVGSGHFARFFERTGCQVIGVDISHQMLLEAGRRDSPPVVCADALRLPFDDLEFDLAATVATLGFVADPDQVLSEAVRVSRRGLLIGALNRESRLGRRVQNATDEPWRSARLLTVVELRRAVAAACAGLRCSVVWRTTLWPIVGGAWPLPWGDFIGMAARWRLPSRKEQCR
jgi:ubiquinone/menaquinone biosynthesis C-methylase UbiE